MCLCLPMVASSSSLNFSSKTRIELGRSPNWAVPNFLKLRRDPSKTKYLASRLCVANGGGFPLNGVVEGDGVSVIIVDHGSRRKESNLMLNEFVVIFRDKTKYLIVEPAHMILAEPSIKDAFDSCVRQAAKRVIVSPFFLFPGRHWNQDVPALTAAAAKEHPGVSYVVAAPLGLHEKLVIFWSLLQKLHLLRIRAKPPSFSFLYAFSWDSACAGVSSWSLEFPVMPGISWS